MNRRDLLRLLALSGVSSLCGCVGFPFLQPAPTSPPASNKGEEQGAQDIGEIQAPTTAKPQGTNELTKDVLSDVRSKSMYFDQDFPDDIYFTGRKLELMKNLVVKFRAVQRKVGNGNFNIVGMEEFFRFAKTAYGSSEVTSEEKLFLEEIFAFDAKRYGFLGDKVFNQMTGGIPLSSVLKVPHTGHYLRKGHSLETYTQIRKDVGDSIILTSGVRALAKQFHLFFEKGLEAKGNMSKASRSLAPPGYSFHGQGDFDVGRRGFGLHNFTEDFAATDEFKKLLDLSYVESRYTQSNILGVRFEPWHIKIRSEG